MQCKRCGNELTHRLAKSYCSRTCSKLHLKSLYRARNKDRIRDYNRLYRRFGKRTTLSIRIKTITTIKELGGTCRMCGTNQRLTINHIRPVSAGGSNERSNLEVLCQSCNNKEYQRVVREALTSYFDSIDHQAA